jgi:hypothetical protein
MKKLVFLFVTVIAMSFMACGNKTANGGANDSDSVAVDSVVVDSVVADSIVADSVVSE